MTLRFGDNEESSALGLLALEGTDETKLFMGIGLLDDSKSWHYAFLFPLKTKHNEKDWQTKMKPVEVAGVEGLVLREAVDIFRERTRKDKDLNVLEGFRMEMTKEEFFGKVRNMIVKILSSHNFGFKLDVHETVDGDELMLLVELDKENTARQMADRQEILMPVKPEQYKKIVIKGKPQQCPTNSYKNGAFDQPDGNLIKPVPMYLRYTRSKEDIFQEFREVDKLRLMRRRMREFFSLGKLQSTGVVSDNGIMPVHRFEKLDFFWKSGWSDFTKIIHWPQDHTHEVRDYFGEEVAFFFHWLNFYTRWLLYVPAPLGLLVFCRKLIPDISRENERYINMGFAGVMIVWSGLFAARYTQRANLKCQQWGMVNYSHLSDIRPKYDQRWRGQPRETALRLSHWMLASIFMLETLIVTGLINFWRKHAITAGEKIFYFGMTGTSCAKLCKYAVTANIKLIDITWGLVSPYLTITHENWRTEEDLKNALITKTFFVKFVVYYYPFFHAAFIMEYVEDCNTENGSDNGCIDVLVENVATFFIFHVITLVIMLLIPILQMRWAIQKEVAIAKSYQRPYTYLQAQAKCGVYTSMSDIDDFMELILSLGFLMMFAVALPVMAPIAAFCNLIELRLHAFKLMQVMRRTIPNGQEGIGAWDGIIKTMANLAVIVNVAMATFAMDPLKHKRLETKLAIFIIAEHILLGIMTITTRMMPSRELTQDAIIESCEELEDDILGDTDAGVEAEASKAPEMYTESKHRTEQQDSSCC